MYEYVYIIIIVRYSAYKAMDTTTERLVLYVYLDISI